MPGSPRHLFKHIIHLKHLTFEASYGLVMELLKTFRVLVLRYSLKDDIYIFVEPSVWENEPSRQEEPSASLYCNCFRRFC